MNRKFGFIKPGIDVHTLGISYAADLLEVCNFDIFVADNYTCKAIENLKEKKNAEKFVAWIKNYNITELCFSYRLDPKDGIELFVKTYEFLKSNLILSKSNIKNIYFAGLPETCKLVKTKYNKEITVFIGDETPLETLKKFKVNDNKIPKSISEASEYDKIRMDFASKILTDSKHLKIFPTEKVSYNDFGTKDDSLIKRLTKHQIKNKLPLIRVHVGPYNKNRQVAINEFKNWLREFAKTGFVDIISMGTSQLTQSDFGGNWEGKNNGGGVPINTKEEFYELWKISRPLLLRAYSATNNISNYAKMLDKNINMAWHALSIWWFNKMDGRGSLNVKESIKQHIDTIKYISTTNKPFEPNVPHHFAFRGADDISYIISGYIAAKAAKFNGVKILILQNMLNTPKLTSGLQDIAKARVLIKLVKSLEDANFKVIYQPRAGLDYFSPDLDKAKKQLISVSALMSDILFNENKNPDIVHVVSYSEASHLATPEIINESVQLTFAGLKYYPDFRKKKDIADILNSNELKYIQEELFDQAIQMIQTIENNVINPYSAEGLYNVFENGYFATPALWECRDEFKKATTWNTKIINGGVKITDKYNKEISINERIKIINKLNFNKSQ